MQDDCVVAIMKFGWREYIEQFVQGVLYMNPLDYFVRAEAGSARHDPHEGVAAMLQAEGGILQVKIENEYQPVGTITGAIRSNRDEDLRANVFCMHALRLSASENSPLIGPENLKFGDTFALLLYGDEFLLRVKAAALPSGHTLKREMVQYVNDKTYSGPLGIFRKSAGFAYQSEYRIALLPGTGQPYMLNIGDISDIVTVGPLDDLNRRLRIVGREAQIATSAPLAPAASCQSSPARAAP